MREMKDSGVEWIGIIPREWNVSRVGNHFYFYSGDSLTSEQIEAEGKYVVYGANGIRGYYEKKNLEGENILIGRVGALCGNIHLVKGEIWFTEHALVTVSFNNLIYIPYIAHLFDAMNLGQYSKASAQPVISLEVLRQLRMPLPPRKVQKDIADYLDAKCAQIDSIIAKQEAIIEKLKEYKLSVITEAVTKGLNPDVEMKDSGLDICKKIPSNWEVSQIRYLFSLRDEKNYKPLEEVQLLSLYTDLGVFPHGEQEERGNKAVTAEGYKVVYEEDIVVNIILAWMGAIGRSAYKGVTSPAYDIYKPINVNSRFYHYLFRTKAFSAECYKYGRGIMAMRWRTYSSEFKSIKVPVPPIDEQIKIADYLDEKMGYIDKTIEDRQGAIDKLNEYKKSLIYEVVTGKKEI